MFKAALKISSHSALSNKDRKKLKKDLGRDFPSDVIDMFFIQTDEISATKLQASPVTIYSEEEYALLVDATGEGDFFPSIYAVNAYPDLVPSVYINPGVEVNLKNGAHLMWPGVDKINELRNDLEAEKIVCVRRSDNKQVVAVGALACSIESVKSAPKPSGEAVYILHIEGDNLWGIGPKKHLPPKWDRKIQEQREEEEMAKLQKKAKKEEGEDEDLDNLKSFLANKHQGGVSATESGKASKPKQMPKELKADKPEAKAKPVKKDDKADKADKGKKGGKDEKEEKGKKGHKEEKEEKGKKGGNKDKKKDDKKKEDKKKDKKKRAESEEESESGEEEQDEAEETEAVEAPERKKAPKAPAAEEMGDKPEVLDDSDDSFDPKNPKKSMKKQPAAKKEKKDKDDEPAVSKEAMKEMDERIMEAFLNAVRIAITDKDLPIECGKLWTSITKCKSNAVDDLDLKLSSYKKIGKFLQTLEKDKILTYEEASKKNPVPKVTKIEFHNKKITEWVTTISAKDYEKRTQTEDKGSEKQQSWKVQVEIVKLFKPDDRTKIFFEDSSTPITKAEAEKQFVNHLKKHNLLEKELVIYNDELFGVFGVIEDDEDEDSGEEGEMGEKKVKTKTKKGERQHKVEKKRLLEVLMKHFSEVYEIRNHALKKNELKNCPFKDVQIFAEKAQNKFITRLTGLEPFQVEQQKLCSYFQSRFATSATLSDLGGKNAGKELTLQGTFLDEVQEFLVNEMGISEDLIKLHNKLDKKKKGGKMQMQ